MANIVIMPKQGLQMTEGLITKWLKQVGDPVAEGEPLFEMETDKLTITIDSSFSGTLLKILREEGEEVPITEPIALIGKPGDRISLPQTGAPAEAPACAPAGMPAGVTAAAPAEKPAARSDAAPLPAARPAGGRVFITPRAKMRCAERGITDYSVIPGSGGDGLIIERDVLAYRKPEPLRQRNVSRISIRADLSAAEGYVKAAAGSGLDFTMEKLLRKAAAAAAKRCGDFEEIAISTLLDTAIEDYAPALPAGCGVLLSAGGIYSEGERRMTVLSVGFEEDRTEAKAAAAFLTQLRSLLENPLLMMAI